MKNKFFTRKFVPAAQIRRLRKGMGIFMKKTLIRFAGNFLKCGLAGWCMEIVFTSLDSLRRRDMSLKGNTSLWMFPIYGSAAFLTPFGRLLGRKSPWVRGSAYAGLIFSMEYVTGRLLSKHKLCPWDYGRSRWNVGRVIRLDFVPFWFCAGLLLERLLCPPHPGGRKASHAARQDAP